MLKAQPIIRITNEQARWCLENNERVFVLTERLLTKDSIIIVKESDEKSFLYKIEMLNIMLKNNNTIIANQNKANNIIVDQNKELKKAVKKNKWMFNTLKVIGLSEAGVIIVLIVILSL